MTFLIGSVSNLRQIYKWFRNQIIWSTDIVQLLNNCVGFEIIMYTTVHRQHTHRRLKNIKDFFCIQIYALNNSIHTYSSLYFIPIRKWNKASYNFYRYFISLTYYYCKRKNLLWFWSILVKCLSILSLYMYIMI